MGHVQNLVAKTADKALRRMPRNVTLRIRDRLGRIAVDPYAEHPNVTKLQNRPGYRRRVGSWRVIYEIQGLVSVLVRSLTPPLMLRSACISSTAVAARTK